MQDLNEDHQKDRRSDEDIALTGAALVFQIPSLIDKMHNLVQDIARIDKELTSFNGLPDEVRRVSSTLDSVQDQIDAIQECIKSIPSSITDLATKIDANNQIAIDTSNSFKSQFLEPRDKIKDAYIRWTWKVLNAIALLCALGVAQVLGLGKWAATIIKAAL